LQKNEKIHEKWKKVFFSHHSWKSFVEDEAEPRRRRTDMAPYKRELTASVRFENDLALLCKRFKFNHLEPYEMREDPLDGLTLELNHGRLSPGTAKKILSVFEEIADWKKEATENVGFIAALNRGPRNTGPAIAVPLFVSKLVLTGLFLHSKDQECLLMFRRFFSKNGEFQRRFEKKFGSHSMVAVLCGQRGDTKYGGEATKLWAKQLRRTLERSIKKDRESLRERIGREG
jgi:hypothetical protein